VATANQQVSILLDRGLALSDGTVMSLQDKHELKKKSESAPSQVPRSLANQSYWARLCLSPVTISTSTTVNTLGAFSTALQDFSQYADYTAVFDQYCIVEVVFRFVPVLEASLNTTLSTLITAIDHDDDTAPPNIASIQGHTTCLETTNKGQTRLIRPRFAYDAYGNSAFGAYANRTGYIDSASPNVKHYGVKYVMMPTGNVFSYQVFEEAIVHFRDNQ
jgi:hypothetical protein